MRRLGRVLVVLTTLVLLAPSQALADDDPEPTQWPTVANPGSAGSDDDPEPVTWPQVKPA